MHGSQSRCALYHLCLARSHAVGQRRPLAMQMQRSQAGHQNHTQAELRLLRHAVVFSVCVQSEQN
eukprot:2020092-Amphidinium_carterae.1